MKRFLRHLFFSWHALVALGLICLVLLGLGFRRAVYEANHTRLGHNVPFTLESALQYRAAAHVYHHGMLPDHDPAIQYPEGIQVKETDTVMAEYVYAYVARLLPSTWNLSDRIRWITAAWFCLSIPLMALWCAWWTGSKGAGLVAGLLYAGSLASVIRSTGQELSRENFSFPFLFLFLAASAWGVRAHDRKLRIGCCMVAGAALAMALATWDMIQYVVILMTLIWSYRLWRYGRDAAVDRLLFSCVLAGLIVAALFNPYLRAHGFIVSPAMLLLFSSAAVIILMRVAEWKCTFLIRSLIYVAPFLVLLFWADRYEDSYSHFGDLLLAKLRYLNQKPDDPALLTFSQRIMWVPALDSSTWGLTKMLFPGSLYISLIAIGLAIHARLRAGVHLPGPRQAEESQYIFYFVVSLLAYTLFVRFHVFVAIFATVWVAWLWAWASKRNGWLKGMVGLLLLFTVYVEWSHVLREPGQWGRPNVYYAELIELTGWIREHIAPEPVLANFGVSAAILTYGNSPIILHPKFESKDIRNRVESYGEALFRNDEEYFRNWADQYGARYYVHALGEFATIHPELQMRYFVNALNPPEDAAARVFEYAPDSATYFEFLWGNRKYRVFRVISGADEEKADLWTIQAERALRESRLDDAEQAAWHALTLFPSHSRAREVIARASAARDVLEENP